MAEFGGGGESGNNQKQQQPQPLNLQSLLVKRLQLKRSNSIDIESPMTRNALSTSLDSQQLLATTTTTATTPKTPMTAGSSSSKQKWNSLRRGILHQQLARLPQRAKTPEHGDAARRCCSSSRVRSMSYEAIDIEAVFRGQYDLLGPIGSGATATVMLGQCRRGTAGGRGEGDLVAIKSIPLEFVLKKAEFRRIANEIPVLKELSHPNIIRYRDVCLTQSNLYIVLEYAEGRELFEVITSLGPGIGLQEQEAARVACSVASALAYLHERGIVHADLKLENCIVNTTESGATTSLKIIDFGLAHFIQPPTDIIMTSPATTAIGCITPRKFGKRPPPESSVSSMSSSSSSLRDPVEEGGTLGYRAPELLHPAKSQQEEEEQSSVGEITPAADMWALGVIVFILLSGFPPFVSNSDDLDPDNITRCPFWLLFNTDTKYLRESITQGTLHFVDPFWSDISEQAKEFVSGLLTVNPQLRMTAKQALQHPWLAGIQPLCPPIKPSSSRRTSSSPLSFL